MSYQVREGSVRPIFGKPLALSFPVIKSNALALISGDRTSDKRTTTKPPIGPTRVGSRGRQTTSKNAGLASRASRGRTIVSTFPTTRL